MKGSSSNIIPRDQLTAYQRWELRALQEEQEKQAAEPVVEAPPVEPVVVAEEPLPIASGDAQMEDCDHPDLGAAAAAAYPTAEEIEQLHLQAYNEGHAAGLAQGLAQGHAQAASDVQQFHLLLNQMTEALQQIDEDIAADLLQTALDMTRQIVRTVVRTQPELITQLVREAIASLPHEPQHPRLFLHPEDAVLVHTLMSAELAHARWKIVEDAALQRGECRVETTGSEIDATLGGRWARVVAALGRDDSWLVP